MLYIVIYRLQKEAFSKTYTSLFGFDPAVTQEILEPVNAGLYLTKYVNSKIDQAEIEELSLQKLRKP